jgi:hypothetical protein
MLRVSTLLAAGLVAGAATAAGDPALQGCWRSQQIRVTLADGSQRDQNGDCVIQYDGTQARSRCHGDKGDTENVSGYEVGEPGRLRVTPASGAPSELRYRVEDDWLLVERPLSAPSPAAAPTGRQPVSLQSVSIRDKGAACQPRGENRLRVGRTPVSSLALTLPAGWEPRLVDPASDPSLASAVNVNFFLGAFVAQAKAKDDPRPLVIVLDDVRHGPLPVRAAEFAEVKKRFARELAPIALSCDEPDRACAFLRQDDGTQVYSEMVNVSGRAAMVSATVGRSKTNALPALREAVRVFVERLRQDNAR